MTTLSAPSTSCFLRLPPEIRNVIYDYCLTSQADGRRIVVHNYNSRSETTNLELALFHLNKQIHAEASSWFYGSNVFCFQFSPQALSAHLLSGPFSIDAKVCHKLSISKSVFDGMKECRIEVQARNYQRPQVSASFNDISTFFVNARRLKWLHIEIRGIGLGRSTVGIRSYKRLLAPFEQLRGLESVSIHSERHPREESEALEAAMRQPK
ncbi:MAG: hypothetical protein M1836_002493 [Candelina mexicana]|nr:MAG: hypothetical protein M1836_002493 [Candelina mexicana]